MTIGLLVFVVALQEPPPCPQIDVGTFDLLVDRAILSIEAGETSAQTIKELRDWCKSLSIHLDSSQLACLRKHVRKLREDFEQDMQIASVCDASSFAILRKGFEAAKARGDSRTKSLGATLRSLFPQSKLEKTDDEWVALGKQLACRFSVLEHVYGPPKPRQARAYDKETFNALRIPSGLLARFRNIARGVCGGPDGLNAAANLDSAFTSRKPPAYSYDEIRGFTLGSSVLTWRRLYDMSEEKSWEIIARKIQCEFALTELAEDIEKLRPPPTTAGAFDLRVGVTYLLPKEIPMVPIHNPKGVDQVFAAIEGMKIVPAGGRIKVLSIVPRMWPPPWYQVKAWDAQHRQMGNGWVNGQALIGLVLKVK